MFHNVIDLGPIGPLITFALGLILFLTLPLIANSTRYQNKILQTYLGICFNSVGHAVLDKTKIGPLKLHASSLTDFGLYKIERDGTAYYFDDNANLTKRFYGGYLGLTTTKHEVPCFTTPRVMEVAEEEHEKAADDDLVTIESEKEREEVMHRDIVRTKKRYWESNTTAKVQKSNRLVSPGYVRGVLRHKLTPYKVNVAESFVKESQSLLGQVGMWEKANAIISFIVGFGVVVLGYDIIAGGSGGGGANLPALPALIGVIPF